MSTSKTIDPVVSASLTALLDVTESLVDRLRVMTDAAEAGVPIPAERIVGLREQEAACCDYLALIRHTIASMMAPPTATIQ